MSTWLSDAGRTSPMSLGKGGMNFVNMGMIGAAAGGGGGMGFVNKGMVAAAAGGGRGMASGRFDEW